MQELIDKLRQFAKEREWEPYHSPKNLAMALSVETAELVEHFQWLTQAQSYELTPAKRDKVRDEIGDVLIYLVNLADKLGIDPLQAAHKKIEKNRDKYPVSKAKGNALKYKDFD